MAELHEHAADPGDEQLEDVEGADAPGEAEADAEGGAEPGEATEAQALSFDQLDEGEQAKVLDKLDREAERHRKRLTEVLLEDALSLIPCELCNPRTAGWVDMAAITPELRQRVRIMIGDREPRELREDPYSKRCDVCGGETVVLSGSKDSAQRELPCIDCGGKGWVAVGPERITGLRVVPPPPPAPNGPAPVLPTLATAPELPAEQQYHVDILKAAGFAVIAPPRT